MFPVNFITFYEPAYAVLQLPWIPFFVLQFFFLLCSGFTSDNLTVRQPVNDLLQIITVIEINLKLAVSVSLSLDRYFGLCCSLSSICL